MPASYERNPKRFQTSQNAGTSHCNGSADDGDWRGKFRTRTVTTHIRLRQFHAGTALRGSMYRICAHEGEDQRILPLKETLRTHATGTATLCRVHLQRGYLR
jgi:hypothetical protein